MSFLSFVLGSVLLGQGGGATVFPEDGAPRIPPLPNAISPPSIQAVPRALVPADAMPAQQPPHPVVQPGLVVPASAVEPIDTISPRPYAGEGPGVRTGVPPPNLLPAGEPSRPASAMRGSPQEIIAEIVSVPPGGSLSGRPITLLTVLSTVTQRQQQAEAVHAYWKLVDAVAEYHVCFARAQRLARLKTASDEAADLRTAQAISAAQLRESEVGAVVAQHDLAARMLMPIDAPLPLPADRPHTGPYRTYFTELFGGRAALDRPRMIDQTLPLRNRAIESHATAVLAAEDAADAAIELQAAGSGRLATVIQCLDMQTRQQRALVAAVCNYNHEIADYALTVVSLQSPPQVVVGTLIKPSSTPTSTPTSTPSSISMPTPAATPSSASNGPTIPATFLQPMPTPAGSTQPSRPLQPLRPEKADADAASGNPLRIPPPSQSLSEGVARPGELQEPRLAPPQKSAIPLNPGQLDPPLRQPASSTGPMLRTSNKPVTENNVPPASSLAIYPGLVNLTATDRTLQLTSALHWDRNLPPQAGRPLTMANCMRTSLNPDRAAVLEAYWNARQMAAQFQALAERGQWLESIAPMVVAQATLPPTAMLQLRAARLAFEAQMLEAQTDLIVAQQTLATRMGRGTDADLPLPSSVPFAGRFPLTATTAHRSWLMRSIEAAIPAMELAVMERASAVIASDISRAEATAAFQSGRATPERVLATIDAQTEQTSAFLQSLTDYNRRIGDNAIATLPPGTKADSFLAALSVQ